MIFYVDFDGTLVDSIQATVDILNRRYNKNFKSNDIKTWYFEEYGNITPEEIEEIFASDEFFENLKFFDNAKEWLEENREITKIITKGTPINLIKKQKFLKKYGFEDIEFISVPLKDIKGDYIIDKNSILIDDDVKNLMTSGCKYNILYLTNPLAEWQKYPDGEKWDGLISRSFKPIILNNNNKFNIDIN